jgi:hypothetical protein
MQRWFGSLTNTTRNMAIIVGERRWVKRRWLITQTSAVYRSPVTSKPQSLRRSSGMYLWSLFFRAHSLSWIEPS